MTAATCSGPTIKTCQLLLFCCLYLACSSSVRTVYFEQVNVFRKAVKSVQSYQVRHQNDVNLAVLVSLLLSLSIFYPLRFFYFNSEQVNVGWHLLYSLLYIEKQPPGCVFQEKCSTYSGTSTLLKLNFCMGTPL